ncbi:hypothetical protein PC116_g12855 [Phytophthora cactorum]|uniref:Uncharacterized protein n=1 Tax=Phytophthora cactorum TaxID=29920 RepID=A0A8T0YD38_9STRA|nr:hypothetical protein PC111_g22248 [Phytophthora cactorum]KAG2813348.1 hypothetical protein PC113_g23454 [Phytophthora cactorum]KAG2882496.1 hypothetical protein PC117_g26213 [Phytophthora cactorum]KAG4239134.1 hypothetical protein PC116_g12855 [Phytophthora cactorum]
MVLLKNLSDYSILFWMPASSLEHVQTEILRKTTKVLEFVQEKYDKELVKFLGGDLGGDLKKVILPEMRGEVACFNAPHPICIGYGYPKLCLGGYTRS